MSTSPSSTTRPENPTKLPANALPPLTHHITTHTPAGLATIHSSTPAHWTSLLSDTMAFNTVYTTSTFPPNLTHDADLKTHSAVIASKQLGLVNPNGTVARMVDFGPGSEPVMHRTQSLDYGIVVEGTVEMVMDGGERRVLRRGDVAVQRGTSHGWRNCGEEGEWARMFFVLQDCEKLVVGGEELGEDLSKAGEGGLKT